MTTSEQNNHIETKDTFRQSSSSSTPEILPLLKVTEYLFLATFISSAIISIFLPDNPKIIISGISLAAFVFLFLVNQENSKATNQNEYENEIEKKAELFLINNQKKDSVNYLISPARKLDGVLDPPASRGDNNDTFKTGVRF